MKQHDHPLFAAIQAGDLDALRRLAAADSNVWRERHTNGASALAYCCYCRRPEAAVLLQELGAEPDFHDACCLGDVERVKATAARENVNGRSPDGFTPVSLGAFFGHGEVVEWLLKLGADVNLAAANPMQVNALHAAVSKGDEGIVRMVLAHGAEVNATQHGGVTALHAAAGAGRKDLVELLLAAGADRAARSDDGRSAADWASSHGHHELAAAL